MKKIIRNVKYTLQMHSSRKLNLIEKSWLTNAFILSKFWYIAQIFPPNKKHIAMIKSVIGKFLWNGFIFKTNRDQLYLDYNQGGIRLVDPDSKMKALFIKVLLFDETNSEKYLLSYSKIQLLPLNFKEWLMEANEIKIRNDPLLKTTALLYNHFIFSKHITPKITVDFPLINWNIVWKNINYNFITSEDKSKLFVFCNNLIPNKEKLVAYNIGRINSPNCDKCLTMVDNNEHRMKICPGSMIVFNWTRNVIQKFCKIKLNNLEDMLSFEIDLNKCEEKAALWLAIRGMSFCLKYYPNASIYIFKKEIRELRWENKKSFKYNFGNCINVC